MRIDEDNKMKGRRWKTLTTSCVRELEKDRAGRNCDSLHGVRCGADN
jgi:hypothetical protein